MTVMQDNEQRFTGLAISPGLAVAPICLFRQSRHNVLPSYEVHGKGIDREKTRLQKAREIVVERLEGLRSTVTDRIGAAEAEIFVAQKMMLTDPVLGEQLDSAISDGCNAERAVTQTLDDYEAQLAQLDDEYIRERASDLGELKRRMLDVLCDTKPSFQCAADANCRRGKDRIVITEELTPSVTLELETDRLLGFVTERGGMTSHAAILARALGIPAVSGIENIQNLVSCGSEVLLDGNTGEVILRPGAETKARAAGRTATEAAVPVVGPVESLKVLANISTSGEARQAAEMQAEGIGLYRTEFEFFAAGRTLDEDEQYRIYRAAVAAMDGRDVYFRMLDIGADKPLDALDLPREDNPSLGCRGSRLLLRRPELMRPQARALARVSQGAAVDVMYPMVTGLAQFRMLRGAFEEMTADIDKGLLRHGVMFEVPSACMEAEALLREADFGSIGSNDLIQYFFAVDRNNGHVAGDYSPDHEVFWRLLENLAEAARRTGKPLSLCGELAADERYTEKLMSSGIRTVSVSVRRIPHVRRSVKAQLERESTCASAVE